MSSVSDIKLIRTDFFNCKRFIHRLKSYKYGIKGNLQYKIKFSKEVPEATSQANSSVKILNVLKIDNRSGTHDIETST